MLGASLKHADTDVILAGSRSIGVNTSNTGRSTCLSFHTPYPNRSALLMRNPPAQHQHHKSTMRSSPDCGSSSSSSSESRLWCGRVRVQVRLRGRLRVDRVQCVQSAFLPIELFSRLGRFEFEFERGTFCTLKWVLSSEFFVPPCLLHLDSAGRSRFHPSLECNNPTWLLFKS